MRLPEANTEPGDPLAACDIPGCPMPKMHCKKHHEASLKAGRLLRRLVIAVLTLCQITGARRLRHQ